MAPELGDRAEVEVELGGLHQVEALRVRLHQAVLDAVVDHLHEVPGAGRANVEVAPLRRERLEDRLEAPDRLVLAAGHERESLPQAPDPAGDADIEEEEAALLRLRRPALRVAEVRVAAVDDRIARLQRPEQLLEGLPGDSAGRD